MATHLEPVYLANVLLFIADIDAIKAFPFISKKCQVASLTIKTNPPAFSQSPRHILKFFPNINTMVVDSLDCFREINHLPDTVTSVKVKSFISNGDTHPKYITKKVTEIWDGFSVNRHAVVDFSVFTRLERLFISDITFPIVPPQHKLQCLKLGCFLNDSWFDDSLKPTCADRIIIVLSRVRFVKAKETSFAENVHVFCNSIGEGVSPEDFFQWGKTDVELSTGFGVDRLRSFNEIVPIPSNVYLRFFEKMGPCDISFLTNVTRIELQSERGCCLSFPTSVVTLDTGFGPGAISVCGTENITHLDTKSERVALAGCPKLRSLWWTGKVFSRWTLPSQPETLRELSSLTVSAKTVDPQFPVLLGLKVLRLEKQKTQFFNFEFHKSKEAVRREKMEWGLDLSGLTTLTELFLSRVPTNSLPTSLVACHMSVEDDFDASQLTRLTRLDVDELAPMEVTIP